MKIKSINIINGKNKWSESKDKLIHMVLDLGEFEEKPSNKIEGFYERIKEYLPSLKSHRCSEGKPGGFFKRIKEGTWMGHIIEHVALELQTLAGMDTGWGRTRGVKGQKGVYNVVFNYEDKDKGKLAAREAFNVVTDIINDRDPKIDNVVKKLKPKNLQESIRRILREEENKFNPIRLFYEQYLNQQPLYFEDLILHPTYDGTKIMWNIENPNDRSFNYNVLDGVIGDEFRTFCDMINGDYQKYNRFVRGFYDKPRDNCYLNDEDRSKINQILKNKKEYRFETDSNTFFIDLDYKSFEIIIDSDEIDFYGYFNFNKIYKYDSHGNNEEIITRREFFDNFDEDIIDYWNEGLYSFFDKVLLVITSNTAFYDNDYEYFNLYLV